MAWVKIPAENHPVFLAALPKDPRVSTLKMFGGVAGIVNGHMFSGLFGRSFMVKLSEADQKAALELDGAEPFDPMGTGAVMKDSIFMPEPIFDEASELRGWLRRALDYTATLPPKVKKAKAAAKAAPSAEAAKAKAAAKAAPAAEAANAKPAAEAAKVKPAAEAAKATPAAKAAKAAKAQPAAKAKPAAKTAKTAKAKPAAKKPAAKKPAVKKSAAKKSAAKKSAAKTLAAKTLAAKKPAPKKSKH